ncbi:hypothetical protein [Vibrio parahaemolyticus]|uniref:hypothetical protein n=1 Tax=Vibrio parahaemolyticus TaxID=670 RepID=UPI00193F4127|nr:hypothetical protein [Vibrio parahaemolyticus]MBM4972875.1 hypothetical protein [Vibrio parahaemolyticus]MCR9667194.1 DUF1566 domain-containing protein [Vibrio parahaemolyticus]MCR9823071.1 DUF1566 domain-containing protein [Vibrio parahaemolyticus]MCR9837921.1 DUF1566 domain-containing protein [Vibrio parahaemolyticus]
MVLFHLDVFRSYKEAISKIRKFPDLSAKKVRNSQSYYTFEHRTQKRFSVKSNQNTNALEDGDILVVDTPLIVETFPFHIKLKQIHVFVDCISKLDRGFFDFMIKVSSNNDVDFLFKDSKCGKRFVINSGSLIKDKNLNWLGLRFSPLVISDHNIKNNSIKIRNLLNEIQLFESSDWRMPTYNELCSLSKSDQAIEFCKIFPSHIWSDFDTSPHCFEERIAYNLITGKSSRDRYYKDDRVTAFGVFVCGDMCLEADVKYTIDSMNKNEPIEKLQALRTWYTRNCGFIKDSYLVELLSKKKISTRRGILLEGFPKDVQLLKNVDRLEIYSLRVNSLENIDLFPSLRSLIIQSSSCIDLKLNNFNYELTELEQLKISSSDIIYFGIKTPNLKKLVLDIVDLKELPDFLYQLYNIEVLTIRCKSKYGKIEIDDRINKLESLKEVNLINCDIMFYHELTQDINSIFFCFSNLKVNRLDGYTKVSNEAIAI